MAYNKDPSNRKELHSAKSASEDFGRLYNLLGWRTASIILNIRNEDPSHAYAYSFAGEHFKFTELTTDIVDAYGQNVMEWADLADKAAYNARIQVEAQKRQEQMSEDSNSNAKR